MHNDKQFVTSTTIHTNTQTSLMHTTHTNTQTSLMHTIVLCILHLLLYFMWAGPQGLPDGFIKDVMSDKMEEFSFKQII